MVVRQQNSNKKQKPKSRDYRNLSKNKEKTDNGFLKFVTTSFSQLKLSFESKNKSKNTPKKPTRNERKTFGDEEINGKTFNSKKKEVKKNFNPFLPILALIITVFSSFGLINRLNLKRAFVIKLSFFLLFLVIVARLADLQVISNNGNSGKFSPSQSINSIILSRRGQIYIKDLGQSKLDIPITSTVSLANVFFDASVLKDQINLKIITLETASTMVSGALNLNYTDVYDIFKEQTEKTQPPKYQIISKFINANQKKAVEYLRSTETTDPKTGDYVPPFSSWLNIEPVDSRFYPEGELMAQTIGFVPKHKAGRDEAIAAGCKNLVSENENRGTVNTYIPGDFTKGEYTLGYYGLEQKYCAELAGLNGKKVLNNEIGKTQQSDVVNGANLYLTIDRNIQRKAEEILRQSVAQNTNQNGGPVNGTILVMEVKTGKILGMASYPTFDPNEYTKADPNSFRSVATSFDYESGSVIKPLTVAAALNEWEKGAKKSDGSRSGVPSDWTFQDYDKNGKPYLENNGRIFPIKNSQNITWKDKGLQSLSNILRDSINTGIADIQPTIGNLKTQEYFEEKYEFGKKTLINLPGDASGNVRPLTNNINSPFSYATHAFGQGFTMSPIQLARSYTAIANNGYLVEPILVEKMVRDNGRTETYQTEDSVIRQPKPKQVISSNVARLVTGYLVNTIDQGYMGTKPSKGQVPGYVVAGKTGTSEVGRIPKVSCGTNVSIYECNTSQGIYDHSFIGYGPEKDPQIMVIVKLSEPKPGEVSNFAENTTGPSFSQMMKYTLEYLGVPKDR